MKFLLNCLFLLSFSVIAKAKCAVNTVWWGAAGIASYGNNGCGIIAPPVTISSVTPAPVCAGSTATTASFTTTGKPDQYSLTWDAAANAAGFANVINASLISSPITIAIPGAATAATYTASLIVKNSVTGISSVAQNISVTTTAAIIPLFRAAPAICNMDIAPVLPLISTNGIPGTWSPAVVNNTASGTYTFTPAAGYCATVTSLPVTVLALPAVFVIGTTTVCSGTGANIIFNGTPNATVTYNIDGGANQTVGLNFLGFSIIPTGNLLVNTTYNLVSVASATCFKLQSGSAIITVLPALTANIVAVSAVICEGTGTNILFNGTPNATVTYDIDSGASQTILLDATGAASIATGNLSANTTYNLVSVAGLNLCSQPQTGSVLITVNSLPTASINGTATICQGSSTTINFIGTPNAIITYNVNGGGSQTIQEDASGNGVVNTGTLLTNTTYNLISAINTGANTCPQPASGSAVISLNPLPTASISGTTTICSGTGSTIHINGTANASVNYNINGSVNQTIILDAGGLATIATGNITATAAYHLVSVSSATVPVCTTPLTDSAVVTVNALPAATITGIVTICNGLSTNINFNGTPNTSVLYTTDGITNQTLLLNGTGSASINTGVLLATEKFSLVNIGYSAMPACTQNITGDAIVTVLPVTPPPIVNTPVSYCQKETATALTATGDSLLWYTVPTAVVAVVASPVPVTTLAGNTDYYVTQTINGCQSVRTTLTVTVFPTPVKPSVPLGAAYRCGPGIVTLKATAPGMVKWYSDAALTNYLYTGTAYNPVITATTNFYITNTENNCVSPVRTITAIVFPLIIQITGFSYNPNTVCQGSASPVPVTVAGFVKGGVYSSTPGLSLHSITGAVNPALSVPGTYIVKYSLGAALCTPAASSTATITITKNPTPSVSFSYISPVCSSASNPTPLPGAGFTPGGVYSAATGLAINAITGVIDLASSIAGNYTVTYTLAATACVNGNSGTADITITTPAAPTVTNSTPRCGNGAVTVNASGTGTIKWYGDAALTNLLSTGTSYSTSVTATTNFYVTNTLGGCVSTAKAATAAVITPTTQVSTFSYTPAAICAGGAKPVPVTATGFVAGGIYSAATGLSIDSVTGIIDPSTSTPGNYTVKYTLPVSACAVSNSSTTGMVISNNIPTVTTFSYPTPVCITSSNPSSVTAAGFTGGGVYSSTAGLAVNATTGVIDIAASIPATYTVAYTLAKTPCGAAGSSTADITISATSASPVTTGNQRCGNGVVTLNATGNGTLKWYGDTSLSTLLFTGVPYAPSLTATTSFYVTNTVGNCVSTASIVKATINPITNQVTAFNYNPALICAATGNAAPVPAAGFAAGGVYSSAAGLSINSATGMIDPVTSTPGTYVVIYTLPAAVCAFINSSTSTITVAGNALPVTAFSYASPVCKTANSVTPLPANGFAGGGVFTSTNGLSVNAATGAVNLAASNAATYTVTYTIPSTPCTPGANSKAVIIINTAPAAPVTTGNKRCGNGAVSLNATGAGTLNWYTSTTLINLAASGTSYNPMVNGTTNYYVTASNGNCASAASMVTATVLPLPVQPYLGKNSTLCAGDKIVLNPGTYDQYLWQDKSTASGFTVTTPGNYSVVVKGENGCSDSAAINITASNNCSDNILFPTAFSPNGDGLNDNFGPLPLRNLPSLKNYLLQIYNRYGQVVFNSTNPYEKWDGMYRGQMFNTGSFTWRAQYIYNSGGLITQQGNITIVH